MSSPECSNCLFWQAWRGKHYDGVDGWCRRYAPQGPVTLPAYTGWQLFPPMNSNQWCGDYRPSPCAVAQHTAAEVA